MKGFISVGLVLLAADRGVVAGETPPKAIPPVPKPQAGQNRTIDDYHVRVFGMKLPAKWFYRNVGSGRPPAPEPHSSAPSQKR